MNGKELGNQFANPHDKWIRGLTKREHFAGLALQGMLAAMDTNPAIAIKTLAGEKGIQPQNALAECCVEMADALLAELAKDQA